MERGKIPQLLSLSSPLHTSVHRYSCYQLFCVPFQSVTHAQANGNIITSPHPHAPPLLLTRKVHAGYIVRYLAFSFPFAMYLETFSY